MKKHLTLVIPILLIGSTASAQNGILPEIKKPEKILKAANNLPEFHSKIFKKKKSSEEYFSDITKKHQFSTKIYKHTNEELKERFDSVITKNSNGENYTKQIFLYKDNKYYSNSNNYFWNPSTKKWDLAQEFIFDYDERGNLTSEIVQEFIDNTGSRNEYTYNASNERTSTKYSAKENNKWVYMEKLAFEYQNGNMTKETAYKSTDGTDKWTETSYSIASYDSQHRQTDLESYYKDGTKWEGLGKVKYEYYLEKTDQLTLYEYYEWRTDKWFPNMQIIQTFDNYHITMQKLLTRDTDDSWTGENTHYSLYTYDKDWWVTEETNYMLDQVDNVSYYPDVSFVYSYTKDGDKTIQNQDIYQIRNKGTVRTLVGNVLRHFNPTKKLLYFTEKVISGNNSSILYEEKYTYNKDNFQTSEYIWDYENGVKKASNASVYTYDTNNNMLLLLSYSGSGTDAWTESMKWEYMYQQNYLVSKLGYMKFGDTWYTNFGEASTLNFSINSETILTPFGYNSPYKILTTSAYNSDGSTNWLIDKSTLYYSPLQTMATNDISRNKIDIYPNPTTGILNINLKGNIDVKIYDMTGKLIKTANTAKIDISSLPKGVYIVNINGQSTKIIKK